MATKKEKESDKKKKKSSKKSEAAADETVETTVETTIETPKETVKEVKEEGNLSVTAENIFPIIKKWLYTEKEIFIRELVSNATDAIAKLKNLVTIGEAEPVDDEFRIDVRIDTVGNKLIIEDNGIGLDESEIKSYINEVAFSGATDFINKFKDKMDKEQLIGHFGLGFYSSFMVSDQVEIESLSYKKDAKAVYWRCDGSTSFSIGSCDRDKRGTRIILSIAEDSRELLNESTLKPLLLKFSRFMPYPVCLNGVDIGMKKPLWREKPNSLKDEDYKEFYKDLYPYEPEPLFWIHLNVDYPFNLTGILFFPRLKNEFDTSKSQIQLYCNHVYVSDNCKDIIPEFLNVLRGAIDSPDIPLNVSRSQLQADPQVRKITNHIIKKIADRLKYLYKNERETYEKFWDDIHPFVKYGAMTENKFWEKVEDLVIFKSTHEEHKYTNIKDYLERAAGKHNNQVYYVSDLDGQKSYLDLYQKQGFEVIHVTHPLIDPHFIQFLEGKLDKVKFARIDAEVLSELTEEKSEVVDADQKTPSTHLQEFIKGELDNDKVDVQVKYLKSDDIAGLIVMPEFARRLKEMQSLINKEQVDFLNEHTLVVNGNHPLVQNMKKMQGSSDSKTKDDLKLMTEHLYDLAMLNQKRFSAEETERFIKRSNDLMIRLSEKNSGE